MACLATVRLLVDTRRCGRGIMDRPSRKRLSCGRGSVVWADTLELDGDLLEDFKEEVIRGSTAQRDC